MNKKLIIAVLVSIILLFLMVGYFATQRYVGTFESTEDNEISEDASKDDSEIKFNPESKPEDSEEISEDASKDDSERKFNPESKPEDSEEKFDIDFKECSVDSDCFLVNEGCCPCNSGGTQIAINKLYTDEWEEKLNCSEDVACIMMYNCKPNISPACVSGKCVVKGGE